MCGGRGQSDFSKSLWFGFLCPDFRGRFLPLSPSRLRPLVQFFLSVISFLKTLHIWGVVERSVVSPNQNQEHLSTYFILFLVGAEERKRFNFGFLLPPLIPFSQSKSPRPAHLGFEGAGASGSVGAARGSFKTPSVHGGWKWWEFLRRGFSRF